MNPLRREGTNKPGSAWRTIPTTSMETTLNQRGPDMEVEVEEEEGRFLNWRKKRLEEESRKGKRRML